MAEPIRRVATPNTAPAPAPRNAPRNGVAAPAPATPTRRAAPPPPAPEPEILDDEWQTGSGMADDFDAWISDPFFGVDEQYNADAVLMQFTLVDVEGEPITTVKYSVGSGWEEDEDGATISHANKTKINNSSRYGRFIDRVVGPESEISPKSKEVVSPDGMDKGLGLGSFMREKGSPRTAMTWDGLGFHWRQHQMSTLGKDDEGNAILRQVLLPTEYIGTWEERDAAVQAPPPPPARSNSTRSAAAAAPVSAPASPARGAGRPTAAAAPTAPALRRAAPPPPPVEEEEAASLWDEIPVRLRNALVKSAQGSSARDFVRAAGRNGEVLALPEEILNYVLGSGQDSFWAECNAEEEEIEA